MIVDILKAIIELGLPLALLSWLIFMRLFISGELDRQSDRKGIERGVKKIKASFKGERKRTFAEKSKTDLVFEKWMYFGSGFYGLAALWTLVVIEVSELIGFVFNFSGLDALFEIHNEADLARAVTHGAKIIGVNNRDLAVFTTDLAISEHLIPQFPDGVIAVSESGIFFILFNYFFIFC